MNTVVVADPARRVPGFSPDHWADIPSPAGQVWVFRPDAADFPLLAARLELLAPDLVVFAGPVAPALMAYARFRGHRVLLLADASVAAGSVGPWDDPHEEAFFLASLVVARGDFGELRRETGEGQAARVVGIPDGTPEEDLGRVRELATTLVAETDRVPPTPSTWKRLVEQVSVRESVLRGRVRDDVRAVRDQAREWVLREGASDPLVATPVRDRPRVLLVSHDLTKTGAPMALLWILRALVAEEVPWELWVLGLDDGPMEELFTREVGERFVKVATANPSSPYGETLAAIDRIDPDAVVLNGSPIYQLVPLLAWKGVPTAWWYHEGLNVAKRDGHLFSTRSLEALVRYAQGLCGRMFTAAEDTVRQIELFCPAVRGRVAMIPYGFTIETVIERGEEMRARREALREELGLGRDDHVFVCVGSLERRKNQKRLVRAFQDLVDRRDPESAARCRLLLVGNLDPDRSAPHNYHAEILEEIRPEHADKIRILGPQPSAYPYMVAADAQVLVSTNECSPLVNIESILLGTYVVSSRVHGIPELIEDGERGTLVDPEDEAAIASGLEEVIEALETDPDRLERRRRAAFHFAIEKHDVRRVAALFRDEVENLLHLVALNGGRHVLGAAANPALERALVHRWTLVKHDVENECHIVRGACHHFHDPEVALPEAASPQRA